MTFAHDVAEGFLKTLLWTEAATVSGVAIEESLMSMTAPLGASANGASDFRLIADSMPHLVWMADPDGKVDYFNHQCILYAGFDVQPMGKWDGATLIHPDDVEPTWMAWRYSTRTMAPYDVDCRVRRYDGEYRWHALRARPIRAPGGAISGWIGTATDINNAKISALDLRLAERHMAETSTLLEMMQSQAPVGLAAVDRDIRLVRVNDTFAKVLSSTVADLVGSSLGLAIAPVWPQVQPFYRSVLDTGRSVLHVEIDRALEDDPQFRSNWSTSLYPIRLGSKVIGVGIMLIDTTEREASEATRQALAAIVDGSGDAIYGVTAQGLVMSWNAAAERLFGYAPDEIIGHPVALLAPGGWAAEQQTHLRLRLLAGGGAEHLETTRRHKDGTNIEVLITASTATDQTGKMVGFAIIAHDMTEHRVEQRALQASERRLADAQRVAHIGSFELDLLTGQLTWSDEQSRILGLEPGVAPTQALFMSMVHPASAPAVRQAWRDAISDGIPFDLEIRMIRADSQERTVRARAVAEMNSDGTIVRLAGTMMDDTETIEADRVRRAAEARFEFGFEQSAVGAVIADLNGEPTRVNPAVCDILGRPAEELVGRRWTAFAHPDDTPLGHEALTRFAAGHDTYTGERRYLRPDGSLVWTLAHVTQVRDETGEPQYAFVQVQDITARKAMEEELAHRALHDTLTGLPNRALLTDRLRQGLAGSRRRGLQMGVIFLDVDHFKEINDLLGHTSGDDMLKHAAERIAEAIRPGDTVARFGGDEFVIVCDDVTVLETEQIAERVLAAVNQPYRIGNQDMTVTASLGIAVADANATPESLVRDSDAAMYRAKERGRDRIELFDAGLRSKVERRRATTSSLRRALEQEELTVHYQPVVDLATGALVSTEALLRWEHPTRGLVGPAEFIPIAEETGLIMPIGAWVMDQACRQLVEWQAIMRAQGRPVNLSMAVNLSVRQMLAPDIVGVVDDVLRRTGARPTDLYLELTESVFMKDVDYFSKTLAELKALGVLLSIDDFGTGFSSLSYLKFFPVDAVKIDRAFVAALGADPHDAALVAAILAMADALGLEVTAEGVETPVQLAELKRLGCRRSQGYYLARPMPADALTRLVTDAHCWDVDHVD